MKFSWLRRLLGHTETIVIKNIQNPLFYSWGFRGFNDLPSPVIFLEK